MLKYIHSDRMGYLKWEQKHAEKFGEHGGRGGKNSVANDCHVGL